MVFQALSQQGLAVFVAFSERKCTYAGRVGGLCSVGGEATGTEQATQSADFKAAVCALHEQTKWQCAPPYVH